MELDAEPTPIHALVREMIRKAFTDKLAPIGITFNPDGHQQALMQTVPGMDPWGAGEMKQFLGFPFEVLPQQAEAVKLVLVSGGSAEAKAFRNAKRAASVDLTELQGYQAHRARSIMSDAVTVETLGKVATVAQVSDFLNAWVKANPNDGKRTDMLCDWIQMHGSFE